jgi:hypothetical protein
MEIGRPGGGAVRKRSAARVLIEFRLIPCRNIERYAEYDGYCIAPHGRVYIEYKTWKLRNLLGRIWKQS